MPRIKKPHLKRRKDGRYACRYHNLWFYGATEDEALEARDAYKLAECNRIEEMTLADYTDQWLPQAKPTVSNSTYQQNVIHLEKLLNACGDKSLNEIVPSDIKAVYSSQYKGLSDSYIRSAKQLYNALFDSAVADGLCQRNPSREKSASPHKGTKGGHRAITQEERHWIETLCTDHRTYPVVMAMLYAGLRPQEAKAINIDRDINFETGIITINESLHIESSNKYSVSSELKTEYSKRQIPLLPPLREALHDRHGLLISSINDKLVTVQAWRSAWESYVFAMETAINGCQERWYGKKKEHQGKTLPPFIHFTVTPYDLRHSFCTMCRDNNVELNTCIHWMGHKDAKMILKIYDEYNQERGKKEAEKLEKSLFGSQNGSQK